MFVRKEKFATLNVSIQIHVYFIVGSLLTVLKIREIFTLFFNHAFNPFQPKLILVHTTVTDTCRRAYKTCKNWPLCSYVG